MPPGAAMWQGSLKGFTTRIRTSHHWREIRDGSPRWTSVSRAARLSADRSPVGLPAHPSASRTPPGKHRLGPAHPTSPIADQPGRRLLSFLATSPIMTSPIMNGGVPGARSRLSPRIAFSHYCDVAEWGKLAGTGTAPVGGQAADTGHAPESTQPCGEAWLPDSAFSSEAPSLAPASSAATHCYEPLLLTS
jgi:hypothetical protein